MTPSHPVAPRLFLAGRRVEKERDLTLTFDPNSIADYQLFLRVKALPTYRIVGRTATFPDEYADILNLKGRSEDQREYIPLDGLFDYQEAVARLAIRKKKFAVFMECGLGKHLISTEFARNAAENLPEGKAVLIVAPLMVVKQAMKETARFYGDSLPIEQVKAADLAKWMESGTGRIGITNYDALTSEIPQGQLGALILDEASMLKSHYGKWGQECLRLGAGLEWKLTLTGTPAPNSIARRESIWHRSSASESDRSAVAKLVRGPRISS